MEVAAARLETTLVRDPARGVDKGPHELKEFAPSLKATVTAALSTAAWDDRRVEVGYRQEIVDWNRPKTEVDLVVLSSDGVDLIAELKVWDIGHQLFDLAKVCCLLKGGASSGFLLCIARQAQDFERKPGGELFPSTAGESRFHNFLELIRIHRNEWLHHVNKGGPEPTAVPTEISTTAVGLGVCLDAYPVHELRAARVQVVDPTPILLTNGLPDEL